MSAEITAAAGPIQAVTEEIRVAEDKLKRRARHVEYVMDRVNLHVRKRFSGPNALMNFIVSTPLGFQHIRNLLKPSATRMKTTSPKASLSPSTSSSSHANSHHDQPVSPTSSTTSDGSDDVTDKLILNRSAHSIKDIMALSNGTMESTATTTTDNIDTSSSGLDMRTARQDVSLLLLSFFYHPYSSPCMTIL